MYTDEQIERAAKAAYTRYYEVKCQHVQPWDALTIAMRNDWKDAAEAALIYAAEMQPKVSGSLIEQMVVAWEGARREHDDVNSPHARMTAAASVLLDEITTIIDSFQDIIGWQPGESRNALVCEIRDKVRARLLEPKVPDAIKDLLEPATHCGNATDHNAAIIEAYKRGREEK